MRKIFAVIMLGLSSAALADGSVYVSSSFAETNVRQTQTTNYSSGLYGGDWVTYWGLQRQVYGYPTKFVPAEPIDVAWDEQVMEEPIMPEPVAQVAIPLPNVPQPVFIFDKTDLAQPWDSTPVVDYMEQNQSHAVMVVGHADECGTSEYNAQLGQARALKTRDILIQRGISPDRIVVSSYGEDMPLFFRGTEKKGDCRALGNRRAEFFAVGQRDSISTPPANVTADLK
ncbi:MAG: OmpA family protein [bacterium]|nr:OmpA family protein [bacterium]